MALTIYKTPTGTPYRHLHLRRPSLTTCWPTPSWYHRRSQFVVSATKKAWNRADSLSTKEQFIKQDNENSGQVSTGPEFDDPESPTSGEEPWEGPEFWEGPEWDNFGFFIQYLWAFGVPISLIVCGILAVTYKDDGATDFKETPAYEGSVQSQELLEGPEESNSDVFEFNPTDEAPSLE